MADNHFLDIDEMQFLMEDYPVLTRLFRAAATLDIRCNMDVEEEILSGIEARNMSVSEIAATLSLPEEQISALLTKEGSD